MGADDYMDREAGVIAAATAAAVSPRARELFRRGAVYGLAGVLRAGDVAAAATKGALRGAKDGVSAASGTTTSRPRQQKRSSSSRRSSGSTQSRSRQRGSAGTKRS